MLEGLAYLETDAYATYDIECMILSNYWKEAAEQRTNAYIAGSCERIVRGKTFSRSGVCLPVGYKNDLRANEDKVIEVLQACFE